MTESTETRPPLTDRELVRHLDTFTLDGKTFQETMEAWGFRFDPSGCVAEADQHTAFHLQGVFTDKIRQAHAEGRL